MIHFTSAQTPQQGSTPLSRAPITFLSSPVAAHKVDRQNRGPRLITRSASPWQARPHSTELPRTSEIPPRAAAPLDGERAFPAAARPLRAAPAGGQQGRAGGPLPAASCPRGRGAAGTQRPRPRPAMDTALGGPALPCPGRRDTSGPSGAGSSLAAARRSLSPRRGARGPRAWREKSAATPERPSPRGAAGGIGPRFPGLSLRAARGDRGLQRPARPRPQVASFPCRPSEPGGGEAGRGTCTKRCWGGGRRSAGRRAPQPLPGWGCRAFPRPRCRS